MISLAKELKLRRNEQGLTQTQVSNLLGITLRQYMKYEKDKWPPHQQLLKLNNIFRYDFSIHIYGDGVRKR